MDSGTGKVWPRSAYHVGFQDHSNKGKLRKDWIRGYWAMLCSKCVRVRVKILYSYDPPTQ